MREHLARCTGLPVALEQEQFFDAAALAVDLRQQFDPGEDLRFARQKASARHARSGHAGVRGDIARADVFFERQPDNSISG